MLHYVDPESGSFGMPHQLIQIRMDSWAETQRSMIWWDETIHMSGEEEPLVVIYFPQ